MKGVFDFTVDQLGPCKVPSPIMLSKVYSDFIANYVKEDDFIRYNVDIYDNVLETEAEAYNNNLIQKAGPREYIYFNPKHVNAAILTCGGLCHYEIGRASCRERV